jgi:hypothetical protein
VTCALLTMGTNSKAKLARVLPRQSCFYEVTLDRATAPRPAPRFSPAASNRTDHADFACCSTVVGSVKENVEPRPRRQGDETGQTMLVDMFFMPAATAHPALALELPGSSMGRQ